MCLLRHPGTSISSSPSIHDSVNVVIFRVGLVNFECRYHHMLNCFLFRFDVLISAPCSLGEGIFDSFYSDVLY